MTGTEMNMIMNAAASPIVMGKPRNTLLRADSGGTWGGALAATAIPTANGTKIAKLNQTMRTVQRGTQCGSGTNATKRAAIFGMTKPTSRSGHATAAATTTDRNVCSREDVWPNSARTAQPKIAFRTFPADFVMSASSACRIAIDGEGNGGRSDR